MNSSHNYCLFVCLVYILFVCLFTFFITMLSWCLKLEQSSVLSEQWTVGVLELGDKPPSLYEWDIGRLCLGYLINIKINSSHNYCLFVCLVYILFVCLFTFFITMLSWCLKLEQSRCTQWTVNSGGPWVGGQATCEVRERGQQQGSNGVGTGWWCGRWEFSFLPPVWGGSVLSSLLILLKYWDFRF